MRTITILLTLVAACDESTDADADADGDGYVAEDLGGDDCDDADASVHPDAAELCDGVDQDCDGLVDDDPTDGSPFFADGDQDGYGAPGTSVVACESGAGLSDNDLDCDDTNTTVHPGAAEICNGLDDDCDAVTVEAAMIATAGFSSLADALAAATDGDVIELCDGTHLANEIVVDKDVTITSASGDRTLSTLDGADGGTGAILVVDGGNLTLTHLTVVNATDGAIDSLTVGGGAVTIDDCLFQDNLSVRSGAAIAGTTITITNSNFVANHGNDGGAVYALSPGILTVTDATFDGNIADGNGGAFFTTAAATFSGVDLTANVATNNGGGGAADGAEAFLTLIDTAFSGNTAESGGGLYLFGASTNADASTTFDANTASAYVAHGGGLSVIADGNAVTWTGGTFTGNVADGTFGRGGAIALDVSVAYGGAPGGSIEAADIFADGNQANGELGRGGGILMWGAPITLSDTVMIDNLANYGAGTSIALTDGQTTTLERVELRSNIGLFAAAIDLLVANVVLNDCVVEENVATADPYAYARNGGALFVDFQSVVEVNSSDFGADATDNTPADVAINAAPYATYTYDADATFTCSYAAGGCQ